MKEKNTWVPLETYTVYKTTVHPFLSLSVGGNDITSDKIQVLGSCECGNEPSGSMQCRKFLG
jgi:hypothetical protein